MFNYHNSSYNTRKMFYSKKKASSHCYSKSKYNSRKYKCTFIELDDNYSYQTTETSSSKDSKSTQTQNAPCQEVTEFTLGINEANENDNNKENNSLLSNLQDNSLRYDKCYYIDNSNNVSLLSQSSLTDVSDSIKEDTINNVDSSSNNSNKTIINLSDDTLKEAFFFPKKLTNMYNYIYNQFQYQYHLYNTIAQSHYYKNNMYYNGSSNNNTSFTTTPTTVNKDNTSSLITTSHNDDKDKENTDVLCVNLKISASETLVFKIRRYDDMFKTVKMFCEINNLDTSYIRPLITYVIKTMNMIYGIMNMKLTNNEISYLQMIKTTNNDLNNSSL